MSNDPTNDPGVTDALELDRICVEFEAGLQAGSKPRIEDLLQGRAQPHRTQLLRQLLLLEIEHGQATDEPKTRYELLERFPNDHNLVREIFEDQQQIVAQTALAERDPNEADSSPSGSSLHGRFEPGQRVAGRYRIVSLLGKGGMGEVYRADDLVLGQSVAMKFLPENFANDTKRLEYFFSEVRLARQVSHPNVCRVHDIGEVDGQHFISMEFIGGEDLKTLLKRIGRLPEDKGIEIARQLCDGLQAAHDRDVLHRDLKPANIMIDSAGQVRITDFGLATLADADGEGQSLVGTPAYMSPEQLARGKTSVQSDIYSLGLVFHEVFTGQRPNFDSDSGASFQLANPEDPQSGSLCDQSIQLTILSCLEVDTTARPNTVRDVARALPGGEPMAAAIAEGKTPSPKVVAEAGSDVA